MARSASSSRGGFFANLFGSNTRGKYSAVANVEVNSEHEKTQNDLVNTKAIVEDIDGAKSLLESFDKRYIAIDNARHETI